MNKKEGKGLKSFDKGFQVPDTYIIIFLVVVVAALLTFLVPKGFCHGCNQSAETSNIGSDN